jgi:hypothetical protein
MDRRMDAVNSNSMMVLVKTYLTVSWFFDNAGTNLPFLLNYTSTFDHTAWLYFSTRPKFNVLKNSTFLDFQIFYCFEKITNFFQQLLSILV